MVFETSLTSTNPFKPIVTLKARGLDTAFNQIFDSQQSTEELAEKVLNEFLDATQQI